MFIKVRINCVLLLLWTYKRVLRRCDNVANSFFTSVDTTRGQRTIRVIVVIVVGKLVIYLFQVPIIVERCNYHIPYLRYKAFIEEQSIGRSGLSTWKYQFSYDH